MTFKIPVYKPNLCGNEKKYILECLETNWISSKGQFISNFEKKFSEFIGVNYSLTVSNGTVALHLALLALGINTDDEVIVPSLTYVATANAVRYVGGKPVFADSLMDTWQLDPVDVEVKITPRTKAIIVVHLYGHPCDMDAFVRLSKKYNVFLVGDCAEAFGSYCKNKHVGTFGHVSTYSFYGNKTITTGEGGMVVTNDEKIYGDGLHYRGQGLAKDREYWHDIVGYNYRMTNICAAIGLAQLEKAAHVIQKKRELAFYYRQKLQGLPLAFHEEIGDVQHSYWMVSVLLENQGKRDTLRTHLSEQGIETRPFFAAIHLMPMYINYSTIFCNRAEDLSLRGINLPSWPGLTTRDIDIICSEIKRFYDGKILEKSSSYSQCL